MTLLSADDDGGGSDIVNSFCCVSSSAEECINDSKMTGKFTQFLLNRRFFAFLMLSFVFVFTTIVPS